MVQSKFRALTTLPVLALCFVGLVNRSSGQSSAGQELLKAEKLRVITYNVQFLPSIAAWANKRLLPDYRATTIGRAVFNGRVASEP